jgi:serine/threonine-protein kinase HipA
MANRHIAVYADWDGLPEPMQIGALHARSGGGREVFEFEFDRQALTHPHVQAIQLDPRIMPFEGPQHPARDRVTFGAFADASPDRWGRKLMDRRLARAKRKQIVEPDARLIESDYLLGVHDGYRVGALRFKLDGQGDFLDNSDHAAAPPFVQLRHLEQASRALETDEDTDDQVDDWLRMLIAPGGSLGGARPKASVVDPVGHLWIAKFPSTSDRYDVGAWELLVHTLATTCGLRAPDAQADCFASEQHTFMVKRFDRTGAGRRLHFASAMTLTDHVDGEDASSGVSYLEIAEVLIKYGSQPKKDLEELWSRIVFNILVSNTDDHLRNHGFILESGKGWRLSEAYDMNPVPYADGLKLNIDLEDNALDLGLARSVAPYFRVSTADADAIIANCVAVVKQWPILANELGLSRREQEMMAPAFKRAR